MIRVTNSENNEVLEGPRFTNDEIIDWVLALSPVPGLVTLTSGDAKLEVGPDSVLSPGEASDATDVFLAAHNEEESNGRAE